jgi:hypothetical protein
MRSGWGLFLPLPLPRAQPSKNAQAGLTLSLHGVVFAILSRPCPASPKRRSAGSGNNTPCCDPRTRCRAKTRASSRKSPARSNRCRVNPLPKKYSDFQKRQISLLARPSRPARNARRDRNAVLKKFMFKKARKNVFKKPCSHKMPSSKRVVRKLNDRAVASESLSRPADRIVTGVAVHLEAAARYSKINLRRPIRFN